MLNFMQSAATMAAKVIFLLALACHYASASCPDDTPSDISIFVSDTAGKRLEKMSDISWTSMIDQSKLFDKRLSINPLKKFQTYDGVGGSFMRAGASLLNQMPFAVQEQILFDLFDPKGGAGFTLGKVPIGATDFGIPVWYTYADEEQNASLPFFTIEHDLEEKEGFVPYVKRAAAVAGRPLRLEATLDYAPQWMLDSTTPLPEADINATTFPAFANYYLKYFQALKDNGIDLEFLSLFNENPDSYTAASDEHVQDLLVNYVAPLFRATEGAPKLTWTEKYGRGVTADDSPSFYEMNGVQESTDMIFYHGYDCAYGPAEDLGWQCSGLSTTCPYLKDRANDMKVFYDKYGRNRPLWMTEVCYATEFGDYNVSKGCPDLPRYDFEDSTQWGEMLFADFNIVGASGWIYWNMILDTTGGPWLTSPEHNDPDDNVQQPVIIVDPAKGEYTLTGVYYAMAHFGRYVEPGAVRVETSSSAAVPSTLSSVSFLDESTCELVTVLMNNSPDIEDVTLTYGLSYAATLSLSPISFTTLKFSVKLPTCRK